MKTALKLIQPLRHSLELRPGVVPAIFHRQSSALMQEDQPSTSQALKRTADSNPKAENTVCKRKRGVVEKRERHEVR